MPWTTIAWRLLLAAGLSAVIGLDRELRSKPAGLRTNMVVGVATASFTLVGAEAFGGGDPTRVASQIVSGIGFLGGGAIFAAGGQPHGLTTAAAMWGTAAIGMTAGLGLPAFSASIAVITLLALWPLDWLAGRLVARHARLQAGLSVVVTSTPALAEVQRELVDHGFQVLHLELDALGPDVRARFRLLGRGVPMEELIESLQEREDVVLISRQSVG